MPAPEEKITADHLVPDAGGKETSQLGTGDQIIKWYDQVVISMSDVLLPSLKPSAESPRLFCMPRRILVAQSHALARVMV